MKEKVFFTFSPLRGSPMDTKIIRHQTEQNLEVLVHLEEKGKERHSFCMNVVVFSHFAPKGVP